MIGKDKIAVIKQAKVDAAFSLICPPIINGKIKKQKSSRISPGD